MGFFDRNRRELVARGIAADRLPPGQYATERFPVLHIGDVPSYADLSRWDLRVFGLVNQARTLSWAQLSDLPSAFIEVDIHCVTKWSKFDTGWRGVPVEAVLELVDVHPAATHLMGHGEYGYTANVALEDVVGTDGRGQPRALLAYEHAGRPLDPEHGYPLRLLVPRLYLWKSAKWLRGLELLPLDTPGFWERNGYHMYGDPFREQRYADD